MPFKPIPERLPQHGFPEGQIEFKSLVDKNPFLFRVHTPKAKASSTGGFTALKFDTRFTQASVPDPHPPIPTYADVVRYLDWTTRHSSAYVSASFSFMWSVWEALRRYHSGVKHDVEIAIIDATALAAEAEAWRAVTVVEVMRGIPPNQRHENHARWYRFAEESQSVLVYGCIPPTAILASVPLLRILDALPSYCLASPARVLPSQSPVHRILPTAIPHILSPHPHYTQFCSALSKSFLRLSTEERWVEGTHGAVELAWGVLGEWFEWMYRFEVPVWLDGGGEGGDGEEKDQDYDMFRTAARTKLSEFAEAIALWPLPAASLHGDDDEKQEWDWEWDDIAREIARLVAAHGAPLEQSGRRKSGREKRRKQRYSVAFSDVVSLSDFEGVGVGGFVGGECDPECEGEGDGDGVPVVLDPRNYLPTPPPTPPPFLVGEEDEDEDGKGGWVEVEKPGSWDADAEVEVKAEVEGPSLSPPLCIPIPAAEVPPSDGGELEEPEGDDEELAALPSSASTNPSPYAQPRSKSTPAPPLLSSETASCLFAGFLIGALLVVVLAQRRPGLVHLS